MSKAQRVRKSVELSLKKTVVLKDNKRFTVCPFTCDDKLYQDKYADKHLLREHQHVLNTAWKKSDFPTIIFWCNFVSERLRNAILFQYAEKMAGKKISLELPVSTVGFTNYVARAQELTAPGLSLVGRPTNKGLLNDGRFPLGPTDATCYVCMNAFPKVQLCPDHPTHSVCEECAIRMIDTWLARGRYLGNVIAFGEMATIGLLAEKKVLHTEISTPCGICRTNVANTVEVLLLLRYEVSRRHTFALIDYKPGELLEAHQAAQVRQFQEELEAARRLEEEGAWPENDFLHVEIPLETAETIEISDNETDGEYQPSSEE